MKKIIYDISHVLMMAMICLALGVSAVVDAVFAEGTGQHSDIWLEAKLESAYALNRHLNPYHLDVSVEQANATIRGTVSTAAERDLAVEITKGVEGIRDVDSRITLIRNGPVDNAPPVAQPENDGSDESGQSVYASLTESMLDAKTTAAVKMRLLMNGSTKAMAIHVGTVNGVVTLEGDVDSPVKSDLAEQIAKNTDGVATVENRLRIVSR
jgi:osmotically-inducible protein OsmY